MDGNASRGQTQPTNVLVIERYKNIRDCVKNALEDSGYSVHTVSNHDEAINLFRNQDIKPQIILVDALKYPLDYVLENMNKVRTFYKNDNLPLPAFILMAENQLSLNKIYKEMAATILQKSFGTEQLETSVNDASKIYLKRAQEVHNSSSHL